MMRSHVVAIGIILLENAAFAVTAFAAFNNIVKTTTVHDFPIRRSLLYLRPLYMANEREEKDYISPMRKRKTYFSYTAPVLNLLLTLCLPFMQYATVRLLTYAPVLTLCLPFMHTYLKVLVLREEK